MSTKKTMERKSKRKYGKDEKRVGLQKERANHKRIIEGNRYESRTYNR
jgi:hypothetical protein